MHIDLFILKNMGAAIIDFRVCPPLVKCKNLQNINLIYPFFLMLEKQQKNKKDKSACSFLSSRIYTDFVWGK
jgi:hypothetical protein